MNGNKYDIVIIGGGTSGVSCAWNCARLGLKTLIIEQNSYLGGSITSSLVIPAMKSSDNSINTKFYYVFYKKLAEFGGAITYCDGNKGWFNPELTKIVLDEMLHSSNVDILFESYVNDINIKRNKILSLSIESQYNDNIFRCDNGLSLPIVSKYYVDATGDAKFCKKINCKILNNSEETQPISLRFIMSGVNISKFSQWLLDYDKDREVTTACTINGRTYLSTACTWDKDRKWALRPIFEKAIAANALTEEEANYFQVFSVAGTADSIAFNAPRLLNSSEKTRSELYIEGRATIGKLARFCKEYLPGFENAYISNIANRLGVRVSTRIKGKYVYTYDDLISGKHFENPVLVSDYPVDVHSDKKDSSVLKKVKQQYELPIESLMSYDYNNLFMIGRCISADFKAQGALRIIPSCFSMGEGLAEYVAKSI